MVLKQQQELFSALEKRVQTIGMETRRVPGAGGVQVGDTLRFLVPVTDDGDPVLMELMAATLTEDADMLQFFTTVLTDLEEDGFQRVRQSLEAWNHACPVGSYGVYAEERQLYHKYGALFFGEQDVEKMADQALDVLTLLYEVLSSHYPEAAGRALGEA